MSVLLDYDPPPKPRMLLDGPGVPLGRPLALPGFFRLMRRGWRRLAAGCWWQHRHGVTEVNDEGFGRLRCPRCWLEL